MSDKIALHWRRVLGPVLFIGTGVLVIQQGQLSFDKIQSLSAQAIFAVGFFSVLVGGWLSAALAPKVDKNAPRAERTASFRYAASTNAFMAYATCFFVAISVFDTNTVNLMLKLPKRLSSAGMRYCPNPEEQVVKPREKIPGCELIYRAYDLGIIKSLGSCEGSQKAEEKLEVCTLRQRDEPSIHYSWRLLKDFIDKKKKGYNDPQFRQKVTAEFMKQLDYSASLLGKIKHVVQSAPKSSHHIFTNLPYPSGRLAEYWRQAFDKNQCLSRRSKESQNGGFNSSKNVSGVLQSVYNSLLFDQKYGDPAGMCTEYTIHWNAPDDACDKLAADPERFLRSYGIDGPVKVVLNRLHEDWSVKGLEIVLQSIKTGSRLMPPPPPVQSAAEAQHAPALPETIVSFQCFMKGQQPSGLQERVARFRLEGNDFTARTVVFPSSSRHIHIDLYNYFAQTLAGPFLKNRNPVPGNAQATLAQAASQWHVEPSSLADGPFPFTRLEYLKNADVFTGFDWLQDREDLLEVYPYYHHLFHFVDMFRKSYRMQRTRL